MTVRIFDLNDQDCVSCFKEHVSQPTDFALTPDGYLLATVGRDKVLNFYELRHGIHVKTVPVMEELSSVVVLNDSDSKRVLELTRGKDMDTTKSSSSKKASNLEDKVCGVHVLVTAGAKGILRLFRIEMKVATY
jgi:WD40 repeat protein